MAINTTTLEANLTTKINATSGTTDGKEFLLLGKAVEALTIPSSVSEMTAAGTTQVGLVNTAGTTQVAAVNAAGSSFAPKANPTFTGTVNAAALTLSGNLTVNGTTTTVNSTTMDVADKNITIADGAADAAAANGAGITVDGASATITYTSSTDTWDFNKAIKGSYTSLDPSVNAVGSHSSTYNIVMSHPITSITMGAAFQFTMTSTDPIGRSSLLLLDTSATPHTPTWASNIKWPSATEPTWADHRYWVVSLVMLTTTTVLASASGYTV